MSPGWRERLIALEPYEREVHAVVRRQELAAYERGEDGFCGGLSLTELDLLARAGRNNLDRLDAAAKARYFLVEEELEARSGRARR